MADLLTHVLVAYILATVLSLRIVWITPPLVTAAMIGGLLPDLNRIGLLLPASTVAAAAGVPFSWDPLGTLGGVTVTVAAAALLLPPRHRRSAVAMLVLGATVHFLLDYLLRFPSGYAHPYLWPVTGHALPGPNLYVSSDRWPAVVAVAGAMAAWGIGRRHG